MKAWIFGAIALALAATGPAAAFQERSEQERRVEAGRGDGIVAGRCISRHMGQEDAESFCGEKLSCSTSQKVVCKGGANRWVCVCK